MTRTIDILEKLIAFDTVSAKSNRALAEYAEAYLTARGFAVHRLEDPETDKRGLYAEIGPAGEGVLLSAHTDVVPVEGQAWTRDPFRLTREGDRLYGRGTTDMKGYVACVLALADRAAGVALREPLKIVLSYDEEVGCVGIQRMLDRLTPLIGQPRAAFVGEPTEMQVAIGHKGKAALRAVCHGESGHSSLAPNFTNALHVAMEFGGALRELQADYAAHGARDAAYDIPYTTFHIGRLTGGTALNIVPDRAEMLFEFRHLAADDPGGILRRIEAVAGPRVELEKINSYPGLDLAKSDPVIGLAQRLAQRNDTAKMPYGTEGGVFAGLGIPTVVCGPGSMEGQGHKPDEYVEASALADCDAMLDRL
ncbi:MAG: acetylornithine deacetylase, partial [Silicimonas sp.]|nr:acetylornithine deacetylase [Silicimonas sp.]